MTLAELRAAVKARGFDDLTDAQVDQLVNDACVELDSMHMWPYREASVVGVAPLGISDLGQVDEVIDQTTNRVLERVNWDEIAYMLGDTATVGSPVLWYLAAPAGLTEIGTYPTSTGQIGVQYWRTTPVLSADADLPLAPEAWHGIIVDIAAGAAYPDGETPPGLQARIDRRVNQMVNSLLADYGASMVAPYGDDC